MLQDLELLQLNEVDVKALEQPQAASEQHRHYVGMKLVREAGANALLDHAGADYAYTAGQAAERE